MRRSGWNCAIALCAALAPAAARGATLPVAGDATISTAAPATNFGALPTLNVGGGAKALVLFDLSAIPAGTSASSVARATLTLWVNKVGVAGAIDIAPATSAWSEATVTGGSAPTTGAPFASGVPVGQAGAFVQVDATGLAAGWIADAASNHGIAIAPSPSAPSTAVFLDSKEAVGTSHAPTLEITLTNPRPITFLGTVTLPGGFSTYSFNPRGPTVVNGVGAAYPAQVRIPFSCMLSGFRITASAAPLTPTTVTVTVNFVSTALTCTLVGSSCSGLGSVPLLAGDLLSYNAFSVSSSWTPTLFLESTCQ